MAGRAGALLLVACSVAGLPPLPEDYFVVLADAHVDTLYDANLTRACKCHAEYDSVDGGLAHGEG